MQEQQHTDQQAGPMHAPQEPPAPADPFEPVAGAEELARDLVALRTLVPNMGIGTAIMRRFDTSGAPGLHAAGLGGRFAPRIMRAEALPLTVSPYAPPQRQISTARQGAPMWRPPAAAQPLSKDDTAFQPVAAPDSASQPSALSPQPSALAAAPPARVSVSDPNELPSDLKALLALHRAKGNI